MLNEIWSLVWEIKCRRPPTCLPRIADPDDRLHSRVGLDRREVNSRATRYHFESVAGFIRRRSLIVLSGKSVDSFIGPLTLSSERSTAEPPITTATTGRLLAAAAAVTARTMSSCVPGRSRLVLS